MGFNFTYNENTNQASLSNAAINPSTFSTVEDINGNVTQVTLTTARSTISGNPLTFSTAPLTNERIVNLTGGELGAFDDASNNGINATKELNTYKATDPTISHPTGQPLTYTTYGDWVNCDPNCSTLLRTGVAGYFVTGQTTNPANIPTVGTAIYSGSIDGDFVNSINQPFYIDAEVTVTANFASRSLNFATTNTTAEPNNGPAVAAANLNMTGILSYSAGSNQFTGTVTATGLSGTATGHFYGPAAQEIGGVYNLSGTAGRSLGVFVAK